MTDDTDPFVRARALEALASLGRRALPAIAQGLKDSNEHVRYTALEVLVNAAPRELTNAAVLAIGAEGLLRLGARQRAAGDGRPAAESRRPVRPKELSPICAFIRETSGTSSSRRPPMHFGSSHLHS